MPIYDNKEYIDWIDDFLTDTVLEGSDRVTLPRKMQIRDMALLISGIADNAVITAQFSPDDMETKDEDLIPVSMRWFQRSDGQFTGDDTVPMNIWENFDAAEGWIRFLISGFTINTDIKIGTRPRVEKVV